MSLSIGLNLGINTPSSTGGGSVNPEQGFDLGLGTPGAHVIVGGDNTHIANYTGSTLANTVQHAQTQPHNDTELRYFECVMTQINHQYQGNIGYGLDAPNTFVGNHADSAGYLVGVKAVRQNGSTIHTGGQNVLDGEIAFCYVRGQRLWFGSYTAANQTHIMGGGDPGLNTSPCVILTQTGNLRPLATCLYDDSEIQINTVGNFQNPDIEPTAVAWDS